MIVTLVDIVNSNQTTITPIIRATFATSTNFADVLVVIPHIIATDTAVCALDKDTAASGLITPAVSRLTGRTTRELKLVMRLSERA